MRAILFKDGVEVRRGKYPDRKMRKIKDLPDGYEWKLLLKDERPEATEIERVKRSEVDNGNYHTEYKHLKVIEVVFSKVRIPDEDIINMIKGYEYNANESLIGYLDRLKSMYLYMSTVHRKLNGLNITNKMQKVLDEGDAKAVKIWKNDTKLKSKLKDLRDGKTPNIKNGWTNE